MAIHFWLISAAVLVLSTQNYQVHISRLWAFLWFGSLYVIRKKEIGSFWPKPFFIFLPCQAVALVQSFNIARCTAAGSERL